MELGKAFLLLLRGEQFQILQIFLLRSFHASTQLSLGSKESFLLFSHDTWQRKYDLNSSSLLPFTWLSVLINTVTQQTSCRSYLL